MQKKDLNDKKYLDELSKFDKEINKKNYSSIMHFLKLLLIVLLLCGWFIIIRVFQYISDYKLIIIFAYILIVYLLFNILVFSNLQINKKNKSKLEVIRKDVNIVINICKIFSVLNILSTILLSYMVYINNDIVITMIYFMPLCGFSLIFYYLSFTLKSVIIKHNKLDTAIITLSLIFILIGIIIIIYKWPINLIDILNTI